MKINFLLLACFLSFAYTGCAGKPQAKINRILPAETTEVAERPWIISDHKENEKGESLPSWVGAFLEGKNTGVEALEEFRDRFAFVAVNSGNNFNALKQWQDGFSPELDFARLAAVRIEKRFLSSGASYPDDEYGAYYETLVRSASDFVWKGAVREDDYWIKKHFTDNDEPDDEVEFLAEPLSPESYDFFVLVTVEKPLMVSQINALLGDINPLPPLTKDQNTAVSRVADRFFEGF